MESNHLDMHVNALDLHKRIALGCEGSGLEIYIKHIADLVFICQKHNYEEQENYVCIPSYALKKLINVLQTPDLENMFIKVEETDEEKEKSKFKTRDGLRVFESLKYIEEAFEKFKEYAPQVLFKKYDELEKEEQKLIFFGALTKIYALMIKE